MNDHIRITAIVGSYRKGGIIDTAIDEILTSAPDEIENIDFYEFRGIKMHNVVVLLKVISLPSKLFNTLYSAHENMKLFLSKPLIY